MSAQKQVPIAKIGTIFLILILTIFKIILLFQMPYFEDTTSYYHSEKIATFFENGLFKGNEDRVIQTEITSFNPLVLYHGFHAVFFSILPHIITLKIIEILIFAVTLFIIYKTAKSISRNPYAGFLAVLLFGTMPALFYSNYVSMQVEIFATASLLLILYLLVKSSFLYEEDVDDKFLQEVFKKIGLRKGKSYFKNYYIILLISSSFIILLLAPIAVFLSIILLITAGILYLYQSSIKTYFLEFSIFFGILSTSAIILLYRNMLFFNGFAIFTGGFPAQLTNEFIEMFTLTNAMLLIGVPVFLGGSYAIYHYLNHTNQKESAKMSLYIAGAFTATTLFILQIGSPRTLIIFAGACFSIIFAVFIVREIEYAKRYYAISLSKVQYYSIIIGIILFGGLSINYTLAATIEYEPDLRFADILELQYISDFISENSTIYVDPFYAHPTLFFTKGSVFMDSKFLLQKDATTNFRDMLEIYRNINTIKVQQIIQENTAKDIFIYAPRQVLHSLNISRPGFAYDTTCFREILLESESKLYYFVCGDLR